ncbi:hypothetical protein KHP62_03775 [Rhodobacteraceae bacterium NNCM2]|nr:hypothetical protein [Coraliihabitans acroporae]
MTNTTFGQTNASFPRATGLVASLVRTLTRVSQRDIRGFTPAEREDIGLSLADMSRIGN